MAKSKLVSKTLKVAGKALTQENPVADGGLSALFVPRQINGAGAALIVGGGLAFSAGKEGFKSRNRMSLGKVSYENGMARMTNSFTSGGVEAMHQISNGDPEIFKDLATEVVRSKNSISRVEDYGASPELISALYNMGGR